VSKRSILVCTQFFALHRWKEAEGRRAYLREPHGHPFTMKLELEVDHSDRAVEFHDVRECLDAWISATASPPQWPLSIDWSCEHWCEAAIGWAQTKGWRPVSCEVWEDQCFGARVVP
jgi:hypothetical protein